MPARMGIRIRTSCKIIMDLVKFFDIGTDERITINVHGTDDEPLFQANLIGELLGIKNIRTSIVDFDDDERCVRTTYTSTGPKETTFFSEVGVYRLLGQSRKPFARPFQIMLTFARGVAHRRIRRGVLMRGWVNRGDLFFFI